MNFTEAWMHASLKTSEKSANNEQTDRWIFKLGYEAHAAQFKELIENIDAAIGDRLMANGPLAEPYATHIRQLIALAKSYSGSREGTTK